MELNFREVDFQLVFLFVLTILALSLIFRSSAGLFIPFFTVILRPPLISRQSGLN